jgi:hypothetical protein
VVKFHFGHAFQILFGSWYWLLRARDQLVATQRVVYFLYCGFFGDGERVFWFPSAPGGKSTATIVCILYYNWFGLGAVLFLSETVLPFLRILQGEFGPMLYQSFVYP